MSNAIPKAYSEATELDVEARAVLSSARLAWDRLTAGERRTLLDANHAGWVVSGRKRDRVRLRSRGLSSGGGKLTALGLVVREAGFASGWQP